MSFFQPGRFYMHDNSTTACVEVLETGDSLSNLVHWHTYSPTGVAISTGQQMRMYMHPDVWTDITDLLVRQNDEGQ